MKKTYKMQGLFSVRNLILICILSSLCSLCYCQVSRHLTVLQRESGVRPVPSVSRLVLNRRCVRDGCLRACFGDCALRLRSEPSPSDQ